MSRSPDRRSDRRSDARPERAARRPGAASGNRPGGRPPARPARFSAPRRREGGERTPYSREGGERPERGGFERGGADRAGFDRGSGERGGFERGGSERGGFERGGFERGGDRGAARGGFERSGFQRGGAGRPGFARGPRDRGPRERDTERGRPGEGRPFQARSAEGRGPDRSGPDRRPERGADRFGADRFGADRPSGDRRAGRPAPGGRFRDRPFERRPSFRPAGAPEAEPRPEAESFSAAAPSDLIWGRHSSQAALESGRPIHRIWCTPEMRFSPRFLQLLREAKASGVLVEEVTWARLGQISGGAVHQGIVLQPAATETLDLSSLIEGCSAIGESPLLIAVDGLTDPQNLGAIVRSAEALGAHGMVLPQRRNAGLTGSVAKVAAGALEHLPVARVVNLNRSLDLLKQEGYRVIGLAGEGSVTLEEADLEGPLVVVTGSEGDGLSMLTRRSCDQLVRIPLRGATPSLNASVATALLLFEVARRGWMRGLSGSAPAPRIVRPALPATTPLITTTDSDTDTEIDTDTDTIGETESIGETDTIGETNPDTYSDSDDFLLETNAEEGEAAAEAWDASTAASDGEPPSGAAPEQEILLSSAEDEPLSGDPSCFDTDIRL
ncbi:MAG: 23S rRNA (guanosine(2251)-2'-O)-methyltransferase RlmB [Cyanobacteriota bacterium]